MGLECPHEWSLEFQLFAAPEFFKHPFHEAYDFVLVLTNAIGQSLKGASGANQCPFPTSRIGAEIVPQDAAEIAPSGPTSDQK